jgi:hypothetical protein
MPSHKQEASGRGVDPLGASLSHGRGRRSGSQMKRQIGVLVVTMTVVTATPAGSASGVGARGERSPSPGAQAAGSLRTCGLLHLAATVPQDERETHRERVLARPSVRCRVAKQVGSHYLRHGPDHGCAGSGCYGTIGPWFCGNGKRHRELVGCTRGQWGPTKILVRAVY